MISILSIMQNVNKVAINSIALYLNMIVTMGATLLGTRFVLKALGDTEYGVYVLVADIVAMFSFLNVSMAAATQRYLSYALGEGREERLKEIFYNSVMIHMFIAFVLLLVFVSLGLPAINMWLDIPEIIKGDAIFVLGCMAVSTLFIVLAVPYEGAMNAHEDIFVIAGINVLDALIKFLAALIVLFVTGNRLMLYAVLVMLSSIVVFVLKMLYCRKHYAEVLFSWHMIRDFALVKDMVGFAGWNLVGTGCSLLRYQGAAILVNKFFGLVANAAYGVSQQLNGFLLFFANSSVRPMRPQIIKSEGAGNHEQMVKLANTVTRVTFILLCVVILPLYINMPYVLELWLGDVPEGALYFSRGFLMIVLVSQLSIGLQIAVESTGRIKLLQIIVGLMHATPIVVACVLFLWGYPSYVMMICIIVEEAIALFVRLLIASRDAGLAFWHYLLRTVLPCVLSASIAFVLSYVICYFIDGWHPMSVVFVSFVTVTLSMLFAGYYFCLSSWERGKILSILHSVNKKLKHR